MIWVAASAVAFIGFALWWRQGFLRDRPIEIWGATFSGPRAVVERAGAAIALTPERLADGFDWVVDLFFSPVWFFWGDLRTRRPARQLRRWRLAGQRNGRAARVRFDNDGVFLELDAPNAAELWASPPATQPFVDQEGLRPLLPIGSDRWVRGTPILLQAFSLGAARISTERAVIVTAIAETVSPERWGPIFDALEALAAQLEGRS